MGSMARLAWALAVLSACGGDDGPTGPVLVGLLAPKTGALQNFGMSFERVANLAVESINAKGGIGGRPIELLIEDTETNADTAGAKLQGLIDRGVIAVVGPATSGEVTNAWPVARDNKLPIISPSSTSPDLSRPAPTGPDDQGYMFRNTPDDEIQGIAGAYYLKVATGGPMVGSVAILFEDSPYGVGLKNTFKTAYEDLGGVVPTGHEVSFKQNLASVDEAKPAIQQLAALANPPTMVVMVALEKDAEKLVQAWDNNNAPLVANMEFFFTDGARSGGFLGGAPASVRGMCGTSTTVPLQSLAFRELQSAWNAKYTENVADQVYTPNVWDGIHIIAAAAVQQRYKYPDEDLGGDRLRDAITAVSRDGQTFHAGQWRDLISSLRSGNDVDFDGASGPNDFDVVGQTVAPYEVWCVSDDGTKFDQKLFLNASEVQMLKP